MTASPTDRRRPPTAFARQSPRLDFDSLEREAQACLTEEAFDYFAAGAGDEATLRENVAAWSRLQLRPHVLSDVRTVSTAVEVLGEAVSMPLLVAPMALQRLLHVHGELEMRRAAEEAGSLTVVSTRSSVRIEDIGEASAAPWWFQVYILRDRGLTRELVLRAREAGARALVLTGDTPILGWKRRPRAALAVPDDWVMPGLWTVDGARVGIDSPGYPQDDTITFDDIAWLSELAALPVLVKGVLRPDDAESCLDAGAAGVIVSNHGGRQLDGAISTAGALSEVADVVRGRGTVLVDGGIRRGTDVLRALALGARAVLVGRPVAWGLATGGAAGAAGVLTGLAAELAEAMALAGIVSASDVPRDLVRTMPSPS